MYGVWLCQHSPGSEGVACRVYVKSARFQITALFTEVSCRVYRRKLQLSEGWLSQRGHISHGQHGHCTLDNIVLCRPLVDLPRVILLAFYDNAWEWPRGRCAAARVTGGVVLINTDDAFHHGDTLPSRNSVSETSPPYFTLPHPAPPRYTPRRSPLISSSRHGYMYVCVCVPPPLARPVVFAIRGATCDLCQREEVIACDGLAGRSVG